jgi:hypothetical protein
MHNFREILERQKAYFDRRNKILRMAYRSA